METRKILAILFLTLGLVLLRAEVSEAAPLGTAFTYQGHLYDNNDVANDLYDFQFKLYDANTAGNQLGTDVNKPDVDVISGYFTVELDFGSDVFNGNARWLEIGVRPGAENDPCEYMPLSPLQEVTAAPYSLQTRGILVDDALNVGIGAIDPSWRLTISEGGLNVFAGSSGETVGFSTERFYVAGNNENYIMEIGDSPSDYTEFFDDGVSTLKIINNKVGIGTQTPDAKLDISGNVSVTGSVESTDAVIMATNTGTGDGIEGQSYGSSGRGVEGWALYTGPGANYGGYFRAESSGGYGVYGYASNSGNYENYGGYFQAAGNSGKGVYGFVTGDNGHAVQGMAFNSGDVTNYGGYFQATGASGRGVYGEASKTGTAENYGGYFTAASDQGRAVYGNGTATGNVENYGGYFKAGGTYGRGVYGEANGSLGRGVYGRASDTGTGINFGGYFMADGTYGRGVYGCASGSDGRGVYGLATNTGTETTNYGGYFEASGGRGRGVYGYASSVGEELNYGGYFEAAGSNGRGVYGWAANTEDCDNVGVKGRADGREGTGVSGIAYGTYGTGVYANGQYFDFFAGGPGIDYAYPSSVRYKNDVRAIDNPLDKVMSLRGVYFNWDSEHGGGHDVGMIAEEVGKVLPEIVAYEQNGIDAIAMDYGKLTPLLVEAVKELKTENELLKQRLEVLEKTLQQLQAATTKGAI
jgi:hypothetical protein